MARAGCGGGLPPDENFDAQSCILSYIFADLDQ
jgi:hypothetical protein